MKKIFLNLLIQIIAIYFLINTYIDNSSQKLNEYLFSYNTLLLIIFLCLPKILHVINFYLILKIFTKKKINFFVISEIFLTGGIINQLVPGLGYIYKYKKLKNQDIDLSNYISTQTLWSILSLLSYSLFAIFFGIIVIKFQLNLKILFLIVLILFFLFFLKKSNFIFFKQHKYFKKIFHNFILLKENFNKVYKIFFVFLFITLIESIGFYVVINFFASSFLDIYKVIFSYLSTAITNVIIVINYFGVFESIFTVSSNFLNISSSENFLTLTFVFRLINTSSLILLSFLFTIICRYLKIKKLL